MEFTVQFFAQIAVHWAK